MTNLYILEKERRKISKAISRLFKVKKINLKDLKYKRDKLTKEINQRKIERNKMKKH